MTAQMMTKKKRQKNSKKNSALKILNSFSGSFKYISKSNFLNSKILNYWLQWSNGYDSGLWKTFRNLFWQSQNGPLSALLKVGSFIKNFADILGSGFNSRLRPCPIPIGRTGICAGFFNPAIISNSKSELVHYEFVL